MKNVHPRTCHILTTCPFQGLNPKADLSGVALVQLLVWMGIFCFKLLLQMKLMRALFYDGVCVSGKDKYIHKVNVMWF